MGSREEATELGQKLLQASGIRHVTNAHPFLDGQFLYEFKADALDAIPFADELVREYLLFCGLTKTLATFEGERKHDRIKGYQVTKIIEQMFELIQSHNYADLSELWKLLDDCFFSKLDASFLSTVRKLELSLKRYYLIYAMSQGATDKVIEFFQFSGPSIYNDPEWRLWFCESLFSFPCTHSNQVIPIRRSGNTSPFFDAPLTFLLSNSTALCSQSGA